MKTFALKYYWFLPILLLCGYYASSSVKFPVHDFANYYFAGKLLSEGKFDTWIYFPYQFNTYITNAGHQNIFASYAPNTPFLAILLLPFSWFPLLVSKLIFNCLGIFLLILGIKRLTDFYKIENFFLLFIPVLFFVPIKNGLLFGQLYFILFFLMAECWLAYEKKRTIKMAVFLSIAIFLKIFPALLILVFLFRKQYREVFWVFVSCSILLLFTLIFTTFDVWLFFFDKVLPKAANGEISEAFVANYQSVFMFLKTILVYDRFENPSGLLNYAIVFPVVIAVFKMALIAIGFYVTRRAKNDLYIFSYWILAMLLFSPYGSTYGFILLIPVFFAWVKLPISKPKKIIGCLLIFCVCNIPLGLFLSNPFPLSYLRLFALLLLFILFVFINRQYINVKFVLLSLLFVGFLTFQFQKQELPNGINLLEKSPILVYDYRIENNVLNYLYWNENGENSTSISLKTHEINPADIIENQIYFNGKRLTSDKSFKRKPIAIDGKYVIYLSDAGRGIGFYTLRKTPIN